MNSQIAEINIARALAPLTDPLLADFIAQIEEINALADVSEGFVWRLKDETGAGSSYLTAFPDPHLLINMSVWTSVDALFEYVYRSHHVGVFRDRAKWFERPTAPIMALWWVPAGTIPTVEEGIRRLELLRERGPSAEAFTFKQRFPAPDASELSAM